MTLKKHFGAPALFVAAFLLFGSPSGQVASTIPTVGSAAWANPTALVGPDTDQDGIPDPGDSCMYDASNTCTYTPNPAPEPNPWCAVTVTTGYASLQYGLYSILVPEPALSKAFGIMSFTLGAVSFAVGLVAC